MRTDSRTHATQASSAGLPLVAILLGIALAFTLTALLQPLLIGDGAEYYAMYFAWKDTGRPFMTGASWSAVSAFSTSGEVSHFIPIATLKDAFPALHVGATSDFNHFWLYSALAALAGAAASLFHVALPDHAAFMLAHWLLFSLAAALAYRHFQFTGVAAVLALAILSPMLWYVDKVHTEFFTFCLALSAVIAFLSCNYILSALFLAIASTQNISFAAVAAIPFAIHLLGWRRSRPRPTEIACAVLVCIFILLHPVYYLSRYGVITPQLLAGGAAVGGNLSLFYIWLIDPDVGLLPNWPLGVAMLFLGALVGLPIRMSKEKRLLLLFFAAYLCINLAAQSSTQNLNSGGSPGLARYATWYIPLFFPLLVFLFNRAKDLPWLKLAVLFVCAGSLFHTLRFNDPRMDQFYLAPSPVSRYLQKHAPALYDPPAEIFAERYGGAGEMPSLSHALAIVGPDCRKILVFIEPGRDRVYGAECAFSEEKVKELIARRLAAMPPRHTPLTPLTPLYIRPTGEEAVALIARYPPHRELGVNGDARRTAIRTAIRIAHVEFR